MVKPSPARAINFRGRFEYLQALQELWPLLLGNLQEITIPELRVLPPDTYRELARIPECAGACDAIRAWPNFTRSEVPDLGEKHFCSR